MSLPTPDDFDPTPFDVDRDDDPQGDVELEHPDLTIPPAVIQGFSEWTDPTSPPPWEAEGGTG